MRKILITGANGMLGQDLSEVLINKGYSIIKTDADSMNILDISAIERVFHSEKPDYVIHCAAYTNVEKAEDEPDLAMKINGFGTENLAKICAEYDVPVVYVSTDYVFDGKKAEPYLPTDAPSPLNIYGKSKLAGESAVLKYCKKYFIARTAWLYGIHGKNFVETMKNLSSKPELKVVEDQIGCPTWTVELSNGIVDLIENRGYGIYHVCGSGYTSWYGFAKEIFRLSGLFVNLKPCRSEEFPTKAIRPKYSVMQNAGICRDWKEALADYIKISKEAVLL